MIFLPTPGALVANRFVLRHPIGKGGMGQVWEAHDRELDSACAIKFILDHLARDPDARSRLVREARAVARLRSPHVVTILGVGEHADAIYLAMELLEGETLATRLERTRRLDAATTLAIVDQVVQVLDKAHAHGIVHRDLKPDNIWLSPGSPPFIKVLDFGVAKSTLKTDEKQTATGALMGTPHYMSPEQAAGDREVDHRSDLWALAVIAMESLSGRRPFESSGLGDLLMKIMQSRPPLAQELDPTLPPALNPWWQQALAHDLEARFQSASELALGLRLALGISASPVGASPFAETARGTWGVAPVPRLPTLVTNITPAPPISPPLDHSPATVESPLAGAPQAAAAALQPPAPPPPSPAVAPRAAAATVAVDSTQVADAPAPLTEPMTVYPVAAPPPPARSAEGGSVGALAQTTRGRSAAPVRRWPYVVAGSSIGLALLALTWWRLNEPLEPAAGRAVVARPVLAPAPPAAALPAHGAPSSVAHSLRTEGAAGAAARGAPALVAQPERPAVTVKPLHSPLAEVHPGSPSASRSGAPRGALVAPVPSLASRAAVSGKPAAPPGPTPSGPAVPSVAPVRVTPAALARDAGKQPAARRESGGKAAPGAPAPGRVSARAAAPTRGAAAARRKSPPRSAPAAKQPPASKGAPPAAGAPAGQHTPSAAELQRRLGF